MFPMNRPLPEGEREDEVSRETIGAAMEVHRMLGPGLNESLYEAALCREFDLRGIRYARQQNVDVHYKDAVVGQLRLDLVVEDKLIVELKAVDAINAVHKAQCITYLSITGLSVALIINFNVSVLKDGLKRVVCSHLR